MMMTTSLKKTARKKITSATEVAVTEDVAAATVVILMTNTSHFPAPAPSIEGAFSCQKRPPELGRSSVLDHGSL